MQATSDALCFVLYQSAATPQVDVSSWLKLLRATGRPVRTLLVGPRAQASADAPGAEVHPTGEGIGAALRVAVKYCREPLLLLVSDDYPYTAADVNKFFEALTKTGEILDPRSGAVVVKQVEVVVGCRTGQAMPKVVRVWGVVFRAICRVLFGLQLKPAPCWYGWKAWLQSWYLWWVYGTPFRDVHCGFKLFRTALLERFPIQARGDFAHVEIIAKATFLTTFMDEVVLSPKPAPLPSVTWAKADTKAVAKKPKFWQRPRADYDAPDPVPVTSSSP